MEIQREAYNRESELILSDVQQVHCLVQGPEDYVQADGTIPMGPSWLLPKKKTTTGQATSYEGFDILEFPKGGAESLRENLQNLRDRADAAALLTKPAGAKGTNGKTVGQSGVSKRLDSDEGNHFLGQIAAVLQRADIQIAEMMLTVRNHGTLDPKDADQI
jgi:hypothetical protein